jgi:two-component system nitrogen regulation sensor histidine kinase NtrY
MAAETEGLRWVTGLPVLRWARQARLAGKLALLLAGAGVASGTATFVALTRGGPAADPRLILPLLLLDLALLLMLIAVVARQLVRLWVERRRGSAGSKLHVRIVALFSLIAVVPAILMAVFSVMFVSLGVQAWFSDRVTTAVKESVAVAEAYILEHRKSIQADVLAMAVDLNREAPRLMRNSFLFGQVLETQARLRSLSEAIVFDGSGRVLARTGLSLLMEFERIPDAAIAEANRGDVAITTSEKDDRVRALVKLDGFLDAYLYVGRFIDARVIDHYESVRDAAAQYQRLEASRSQIEVTFALLFIVVALLVLLTAIWSGLSIATRLVRPIGGMVAAAERVREGDFSARVPEGRNDDEMATLGRAFNRMTSQLAAQRGELVEANRQLDERRRFTETVLAGVSAGVIGIGRDGRITLANPSAVALLGLPGDALIGRLFAAAVPEMASLLAEATIGGDRQVEGQLSVGRSGRSRNLLVRVSRETTGGNTVGYVLTFDDITELVAAQRTAAWADVARRIAHEIKNPLTPIQLSAERLKRKYLKEVVSDPEVFSKCTDTIIRQVGDIGRMVDEFSAFARLPAPVFRVENLTELVRQGVFLQQVAHADIDYAIDLPEAPLELLCDGRQVAQALTNVLQNAAQAIEAREAAAGEAPLARGRIAVAVRSRGDGTLAVEVVDNGRGLPAELRDRLTEPYITTRSKGTGLGLAIVKKIMEEHGGQLVLEDGPEPAAGAARGARIRLLFPERGGAAAATTATGRVGHGV